MSVIGNISKGCSDTVLRLWKRKSSYMVIRMLEVRRGFQGSFSAKLGVDEFDPQQIAPTIAMIQKIVKRCRSDTQWICLLQMTKSILFRVQISQRSVFSIEKVFWYMLMVDFVTSKTSNKWNESQFVVSKELKQTTVITVFNLLWIPCICHQGQDTVLISFGQYMQESLSCFFYHVCHGTKVQIDSNQLCENFPN